MTATRRIAFIDPSITDWKTLLAGLSADIEVVILDSSYDGLLQIADSLRGASGLLAIHIFSHGSSGELMLGDAVVNAGNLQQYSAALATIGSALTETGDILLYGCNVAQGDSGQTFIAQLAAATGADVAASTDLTGNAAQGGDWVLEAATGAVEAPAVSATNFAGMLGLTVGPLTYSFPFHGSGEARNSGAMAALRVDGSVVTWGDSSYGGDSSAVASQIDGTIDVTQVFSADSAFAALRADGSAVTWGDPISGGDSSAVASQIDGSIDVTQIFSTSSAFAALRADGSVMTWGSSSYGGDSSAVASQIDGTIDVTQVFSTSSAFAALRTDGSVVTWGLEGGDSSAVASQIDGSIDVTQVFSASSAFAALRADGSVVTWGLYGGDSSAVASQIDGTIDVMQAFSTSSAFAALRADGSVVTWGISNYGGDSSTVASQINGSIDVTQIFSTSSAFAALRADGSVVTWGSASYAGDSSAVASQIDGTIDVMQVFSTKNAFAALRADGSVVTWGDSSYGGHSSAVASQIDGSIDVTQVFSADTAFAALRADGSVVTWGNSYFGGDSSTVASQINGSIDVTQVFSMSMAFAALRADGSVVTWGHPYYGGDSSAVASQIDGTIDVVWMADPFHDDVYTASSPGDNIREGTDTTTILAVGATLGGEIDAEPISGDGVTSDGAGGYIDKDWYQVTLTAGHSYHFGATAGISSSDTLDAVAISVKDSSGATVSSLVDSASPSLDYTPVSGGTYYLAVSAGGSGTWQTKTGSYQISVTDNGVPPVTDTDTVREGTDTTTTLAVGATLGGVIDAEPISGDGVTSDGAGGYIDKDWYQVTLTAGHSYHFGATAGISSSDTLDAVAISVKDSSGATVSSLVDSASPSLDYTPVSGGTYYLAVSAGGSGTWQTKTGSYQISVTDNGVPPVTDTDTVREGTDTTTILAVGATLGGEIDAEPISGDGVTSDGAGGYIDKDWYQVTLDKGNIYTFSGSAESITTGLLDISLYSQNGTPINTLVEGAHPSFTFDTTSQTGSTQTYYIAVSAGGANPAWKTATGDYSVSLTKQSVGGPNTKDIKVEFSTASWTQQSDGQFLAAGNALIGLSSDAGSLLRIEGGNYTLTENTLNVTDARVYSIAGGVEYALFTGNFSLSLDDPTGVINETQGLYRLAGLGTDFSAMHLLPGEVRVTTAFNLPQLLLGNALGLTGETVVFKQGGPQLGLGGSIDLASQLKAGGAPSAFHLLGKIGLEAKKLELSYDAFDDKLALSGDVSLLNYPNKETPQGSSPILSLSDAGVGIQHGVAFAKGTIKSNGFDFAGGWGLSDVKLTFDSTEDQGSGTAKLTVPLAHIPDVTGTIDFSTSPEFAVTGFALEFSSDVGIPIGTTGVNLRSLGGGASNLWSATDPIVWKGIIGLDWLDKLLYAKFTGESDFKESVSGNVKGSFLGENTGFVEFDGNGKLNWIDQTLKASGNINIIYDLIKGSASIDASNFTVPLVAAMGTAEFKYLGVDLTGNLSLKLSADGNPNNDYAAAWAVVPNPLWKLAPLAPETITCGLRVDLDGNFDLQEDVHVFGAQEVPLYASWIVDATVKDLTVFVNWEQAATGTVQTRVVVYDDLAKTQVREIINEADYLTHGIAVVDAWSNSFAKVVYIAAPDAGVWDVEVVNSAGLGQINYSATTSLVEDTLKLTVASVSSNQIQVDYAVTGPLEKAGLTFFADTDAYGFDGIPIRAIDISDASGKFSWDISGLKDGQYWIYAMLEDGQRVPVGDYADNSIQIVSRIEGTDAADILSVGTGTRGYTILGLAGNDRLSGGSGNDTMDGGSGIDTANYSESRSTFQITKTSAGYSVFGASDGTDTLINIERLQFTDKTLAFDLDGNAGQAYRLYQAAFDRVPDQGGLGYWIDQMDSGVGLSQVATGFINSAEFKSLYGNNPSDSAFVTLLYDNVLHRAPDAGGYAYWINELTHGVTREQALIGFSESTENKVALMAFDMDGNMGKDYRLYQAAFDRQPDVSGLDYWYHQLNSGMTLEQVASGFISSAEFKALYGNNPSNAELVTLLYDNVLHRAPDTGGFNYWMNELDHGTSKEQVLVGFSESIENQLSLVGIVQTGIEFV